MSGLKDQLINSDPKKWGFTQLTRAITTDQQAEEFFQESGLLNFKKATCECGAPAFKVRNSAVKSGFLWECLNKHGCGKRFNPLNNTWFERSHLSYIKVYDLLLHWFFEQKTDISIVDTETSSSTVVNWRSFCREVCSINYNKRKRKIGGPGLWVEVDEAHLFRRMYNRGHRIKGEHIWVFGGICRETKERFVQVVPNRKKKTLWPIMKRNIRKGTILVTDDYASYKGVDVALGFAAHEIVIHKYNFVNPIFPEIFTNGIECLWSKLRRKVKNSGTKESVDLYIDEFLYRFNLVKKFGKCNYGVKFMYFLNDVAKVYPGPNRIGWKNN